MPYLREHTIKVFSALNDFESYDNKCRCWICKFVALHKQKEETDKSKRIKPRVAKVGDLPNDKIKTCDICSSRGFPHEPITFSPVYGSRVLSNGQREVLGHGLIDYYTDKPHQHKQQRYYLGWDLEAFE